MKQKSKITIFLILIIILGLTYYYQEEIAVFILNNFIVKKEVSTLTNNDYASENNYLYLKTTTDFTPKNKQDLINIYYTALNSGNTEFTFYCPNNYNDCLNEVIYISSNRQLLSEINNFVHPYNSFKDLKTEYDSTGKVTLNIKHLYNQKEINEINEKVNKIIEENITTDLSLKDKIKVIHDYIINNSKYDTLRSDKKENLYKSNIAYGPLLQGHGICGGYSDAMKIFLDIIVPMKNP